MVVTDLHLYSKNQGSQTMNQIVKKTTPGRVLGLHDMLSTHHFELAKKPMENINAGEHSQCNFIALKTPQAEKCKTIVSYVNRNNFKNVLVIGNRKAELSELSKKLQMESLSTFNLCEGDGLTASEMFAFNPP